MEPRAVVVFVDVGQGDCTIAVDREQAVALVIDCPTTGVDAALEILRGHAVGCVELAVVTHMDLDHMGGMVTLLEVDPPRELRFNHDSIVSADPAESSKLKAILRGFLGLEKRHGVRLTSGLDGDSGRVGAFDWTYFAPTHSLITAARASAKRNRASAVIRLRLADFGFLISGDADTATWRHVLQLHATDVQSQVFLVSHHGARWPKSPATPTLDEVVRAVGADFLVVSASTNNQYGHPASETLAALRKHDGRIMCTEVNRHCVGDGSLPAAEASMLPLASGVGHASGTHDCACAGSITFAFDGATWQVSPTPEEHGRVIGVLTAPQCRAR